MIKKDSKVAIDYTLTVDGKVADTSKGRAPLEYTQGAGQIIIGLERALEGKNEGEEISVDIAAKDAYGEINKEAFRRVPKTAIQNIEQMKVGDLVGASANGHTFRAQISEITDTDVVLNFNHPLAGKSLHFDVKIVSVK
ncbi:MAG: peptidylprolyl isomerase [Elusimicrobiaceae bacterium]|nr:peptidylprolyl isomerase [Elusimicrobiaceae bacterium]